MGISCPGDCSESYAPGTLVSLSAIPASGWRFDHWSGACSGTESSCNMATYAAKEVTATFIQDHSYTLDIDGNGIVEALSDGLLTIRDEFGFTGTALISGAVGTGCSRCEAAAITAYLDQCEGAGILDVDGDGSVAALQDGILTVRYEFGFTGTSLTDGAVGTGCTRCNAAAISAFLDNLKP
jgi:hypothetical protein